MLNKFVLMMALGLLGSFSAVAYAADANQPLTGRDLKDATEMNDVYARHMYSSNCMETQKAYMPNTLPQAEANALIAEYKKSCDCVTDAVLKTFTPNDMISYVTDRAGILPPGVKVRPKPDPNIVKKYAQMAAIDRDIKTRKQCGFK